MLKRAKEAVLEFHFSTDSLISVTPRTAAILLHKRRFSYVAQRGRKTTRLYLGVFLGNLETARGGTTGFLKVHNFILIAISIFNVLETFVRIWSLKCCKLPRIISLSDGWQINVIDKVEINKWTNKPMDTCIAYGISSKLVDMTATAGYCISGSILNHTTTQPESNSLLFPYSPKLWNTVA